MRAVSIAAPARRPGDSAYTAAPMRAWLRALHGPPLVAAAALLVSPVAARAQSASFLADCKRYIDQKGYSTDYIEEKTGKRQPGLAAAWRGNVAVREVQPGDVV